MESFDYGYLEKFDTLALAVSGGKDSMALLHAVMRVREAGSFFVVTVHHNLRGDEGRRDRDFVTEYCKSAGVKCLVFEENVAKFCADNGYTIEQGARIRRREIFKQIVASGKAQRVVTAHHSADNVESILMHIFRGSGLRGLCGMSVDDGVQLRPMLACARQSIDGYVKTNGIPYVEDSSNESLDFTRNKLRREILPLIKTAYGGAENNIVRLSKRAQELFEYVDGLSREFEVKDGVAYLPLSALDKDRAIVAQTVINAVDSVSTRVDLTDRHIRSIINLKTAQSGASVDLPFGLRAHREPDRLAFAQDSKREYAGVVDGYGEYDLGDKVLIISPERNDGLVCDLDKLNGCEIRNRRHGDCFKRYKGGSKSLGDFLTDIKVPKRERDSVIVIAKGSNVYLLPEIEIGDCVKVDEGTQSKAYISVLVKRSAE